MCSEESEGQIDRQVRSHEEDMAQKNDRQQISDLHTTVLPNLFGRLLSPLLLNPFTFLNFHYSLKFKLNFLKLITEEFKEWKY